MEPVKEINHLETILGLANNWIEKADIKVSISLGFFSLLSAFMQYINDSYYDKKTDPFMLYDIIDVICTILVVASVLFYAFALMPNLKSIRKRKKYPVFYGDISRLEIGEYKSLIAAADEKDYADELMNEIYCNSQICNRKMLKYKVGIILSVISLILEIFCFVLLRFAV